MADVDREDNNGVTKNHENGCEVAEGMLSFIPHPAASNTAHMGISFDPMQLLQIYVHVGQ